MENLIQTETAKAARIVKAKPAVKTAKGKTAKPAVKAAAKKAAAKAEPVKAKPVGKRAQAALDAASGKIPAAPDFSAETHKRFRAKLAALVALVGKRDLKALKALVINPISTSPKAMARYRDHAVLAIESSKRKAN